MNTETLKWGVKFYDGEWFVVRNMPSGSEVRVVAFATQAEADARVAFVIRAGGK